MYKNQKGSALLLSVILIFTILYIIISLSYNVVIEQKITQKTKESVSSFFNADSGIEWAIDEIIQKKDMNISDIFPGFSENSSGKIDCPFTDIKCHIYLLDDAGKVITVDGPSSNIKTIRSVGMKDDRTFRAIEAPVTICPKNFIKVPGNSQLGTSDFCVAKYELKCDSLNTDGIGDDELTSKKNYSLFHGYRFLSSSESSGGSFSRCTDIPTVTPEGTPISGGSLTSLTNACKNLGNKYGDKDKYDIISNKEWMTIARNVEMQPNNWTNGEVGNGMLYRGHTDGIDDSDFSNYPHALRADPNEYDGYYLTGNSESNGKDQRRTLYLSNGEVIWDMNGNLAEYVKLDFSDLTDSANLILGKNQPYDSSNPIGFFWREIPNLTKNIGSLGQLSADEIFPFNKLLETSNGIGKMYSTSDSKDSYKYKLTRGGWFGIENPQYDPDYLPVSDDPPFPGEADSGGLYTQILFYRNCEYPICDFKKEENENCRDIVEKYLPVLGKCNNDPPWFKVYQIYENPIIVGARCVYHF